MPAKLLFTVVAFNTLFVIFLAGVIVAYFKPNLFGTMTSLFLGWLAGFVNLNATEPQLLVLLLLAFGFFVGFITPKKAWRQALLLAVFIPLGQITWIIATNRWETLMPEGVGSLIAFLPAFGGTYLGQFIARGHRQKLA
jgi:hypothetical protein